MYAAKYYLSISGTANNSGRQFTKTHATPFIPKVGDDFWIGDGSIGGANSTAEEVYYNLTTGEFDVFLDGSKGDWRECDTDELKEITEVLHEQGWVTVK